MAARQEVLKACADWRTLREVQEATGLSIGYLRNLRAEYLEGGYLEERFEDGIGRQYRATGKVCPEWEAPSRKLVLESLSGGPKTARQIADGTGMTRKDATNALARMEALGLVAREGTTRFTWRLVP